MSIRNILAVSLAVAFPMVFAAGPALLFAAEKTVAYTVDPEASTLKWVGKKVTGQHNGFVPIKEGDLRVADGQVVGGTVVIDMANITDLDLEGESKEKLTGHLKSDDFFGVEKHPTASFEIKNVEPAKKSGTATHTVTGDLTVKGKTHPLTFPATIKVSPAKVTASAKGIKVDRTLYDVRYGSGKFFENLGDKAIDDIFTIDLDLTATK